MIQIEIKMTNDDFAVYLDGKCLAYNLSKNEAFFFHRAIILTLDYLKRKYRITGEELTS